MEVLWMRVVLLRSSWVMGVQGVDGHGHGYERFGVCIHYVAVYCSIMIHETNRCSCPLFPLAH